MIYYVLCTIVYICIYSNLYKSTVLRKKGGRFSLFHFLMPFHPCVTTATPVSSISEQRNTEEGWLLFLFSPLVQRGLLFLLPATLWLQWACRDTQHCISHRKHKHNETLTCLVWQLGKKEAAVRSPVPQLDWFNECNLSVPWFNSCRKSTGVDSFYWWWGSVRLHVTKIEVKRQV